LVVEERNELRRFDEGVVRKWGDLIREQEDEMKELGMPYFGDEDGEAKSEMGKENRINIVGFLGDLVSDGT
jgi:hypothetical protein